MSAAHVCVPIASTETVVSGPPTPVTVVVKTAAPDDPVNGMGPVLKLNDCACTGDRVDDKINTK